MHSISIWQHLTLPYTLGLTLHPLSCLLSSSQKPHILLAGNPLCQTHPTLANITQSEETLAVEFDCRLADCSPREFLSADVCGHTFWFKTPATSLLSCMKQYAQCKVSSHDLACKTSACGVVLTLSMVWAPGLALPAIVCV